MWQTEDEHEKGTSYLGKRCCRAQRTEIQSPGNKMALHSRKKQGHIFAAKANRRMVRFKKKKKIGKAEPSE